MFFVTAVIFSSFSLWSQIEEPVKWSFDHRDLGDGEFELLFIASIDPGWYLYAQNIPGGGPIPTEFMFEPSSGYRLTGSTSEPDGVIKYDENFDMDLKMFSNRATFRQKVSLLEPGDVEVSGEVQFMSCDDERCLPPDYVPFRFALTGPSDSKGDVVRGDDVPDKKGVVSGNGRDSAEMDEIPSADTLPGGDVPTDEAVDGEQEAMEVVDYDGLEDDEHAGTGWTFLFGLLAGLLALLTPCVFPMIPLTVSFFLRNAENRARAFRDAMAYGLTIVFSYVVLGLIISIIFGPDTLNAVATSPAFNIFFFLLLAFFAASFFGAFELTMPASWSNSLDSKADKAGGLAAVFLMGLTFVLVSFSCTGPIVGTLLVEAAVGGSVYAPAMGMLGFGLALGIPFSLFALFPSALKSLPKSGGWMNAVKVVLGFIVLAFALKFLSIADAVGQWGVLDREVFLVLWIAIFLLMGLYLIGKIKFAHDSELKYLSFPRLMLAIASFAFVFYLIPGLWGAPLKAVSSFLPSPVTQDFDLSRTAATVTQSQEETLYVGKSVHEGPHGLMAFTDYDEGMKAAEKAGKPVLLDFTGLGCANCRKMEANVWSQPQVMEMLRNDFVKISLFVDDRTPLPEEEQFTSHAMGRERKITRTGQKWSVFQAERYGVNTLPYYVILDHEENMLAPGYEYHSSVQRFVNFLEKGLKNYKKNMALQKAEVSSE